MDWDQRAFAWLYRSFRRVSGRGGKVDEAESPVESLTPRFETLSNLRKVSPGWRIRTTRRRSISIA